MIAPEQYRARRRAPAETVPFAVVDELTLGRVTAWPAQRAHELLAATDRRARLAALLRDDVVFRTAILIASAGLRRSSSARCAASRSTSAPRRGCSPTPCAWRRARRLAVRG